MQRGTWRDIEYKVPVAVEVTCLSFGEGKGQSAMRLAGLRFRRAM